MRKARNILKIFVELLLFYLYLCAKYITLTKLKPYV